MLVDCFWLDSVALVLLLSAKGKQASFFPLIATFFRELATAEVVLFYFLWSLPVWHRLAQDEAAGVDFGGNASNEQREIEKRKRKKTRAVVGRGASGAAAGLPIFNFSLLSGTRSLFSKAHSTLPSLSSHRHQHQATPARSSTVAAPRAALVGAKSAFATGGASLRKSASAVSSRKSSRASGPVAVRAKVSEEREVSCREREI